MTEEDREHLVTRLNAVLHGRDSGEVADVAMFICAAAIEQCYPDDNDKALAMRKRLALFERLAVKGHAALIEGVQSE